VDGCGGRERDSRKLCISVTVMNVGLETSIHAAFISLIDRERNSHDVL
jgi:hypothetical protein